MATLFIKVNGLAIDLYANQQQNNMLLNSTVSFHSSNLCLTSDVALLPAPR